jgi:predicted SAM-dependent methyltransferase
MNTQTTVLTNPVYDSVRMPKPDENGWVRTLNNMGYMSLSFDPYTEQYLQFCAENPEATVFEGGAAFGQAVLAALKLGVKVVANDKESKHLQFISESTPHSLKPLLTLCVGSLPFEVNFPTASFDAILSSRMLHFLTGHEIELCIKKFFSWLKKGGKIFLIAETPYLKCYAPFIATYEQRKREGAKWPGLVATSRFRNIRYNNLPSFLHFLDPEVLSTICEKSGFVIEKSTTINRMDFPPELRFDGRESVGIIASKP